MNHSQPKNSEYIPVCKWNEVGKCVGKKRRLNALMYPNNIKVAKNTDADHSNDDLHAAKKRRVGKKCIRFAETTTEISFEHSFAEDELLRTWYSDKEYQNFRLEMLATLIVFARAGSDITSLNPEKYCLRGLESHITPRHTLLLTRQLQAHSRIVVCKDKDKVASKDPYSLKLLSTFSSKVACNLALRRGALDASDYSLIQSCF
jgi:hypothetical protein